MSQTEYALIPISAQVLVLSETKDDLVNLKTTSPNDYSSDILMGKHLKPDVTDKYELEEGVHIHWSLPKELKHGKVDTNDELIFPTVPNRWLVTRITLNDKLENLKTKNWLVRSDEIVEDNEGKMNWVTLKKDEHEQCYDVETYIGNCIDLENLNNDELTSYEALESLEAVGNLSPMYSSIYAESGQVFGFYDPLEEEEDDESYSYVITGWYSDITKDPIDKENEKIVTPWLKGIEGSSVKKCLFHTTIQQVAKSKKNDEWSDKESNVEVYVGNTAVEAFSTMFCNDKLNDKTDEDKETLLSSLQYQLLEDTSTIHNLPTLKSENDKRNFTPIKLGIIWEILRKEEFKVGEKTTQETNSIFPENIGLVRLLNNLNKEQHSYDTSTHKIKKLRQEYYLNWEKISEIIENESERTEEILKNAYEPLEFFKNKIKKTQEDIKNTEQRIRVLILKIEEEEGVSFENTNKLNQTELKKEKANFRLTYRAADRFWEANDPIVLLYGKEFKGTDVLGDTTVVSARTSQQLILKLSLENNIFKAEDKFSAIKDSLSNINHDFIPHETIDLLIYEALLLNPKFSKKIASIITGEPVNRTSGKLDKAEESIKELQEKRSKQMGEGVFPHEKSIHSGAYKWNPVFMTWEVAYTREFEKINSKTLLDQLKTSDTNNSTISFEGFAPITSSVFQNLTNFVDKKDVSDYQYCVSQALGGMHKKLKNLETGVQLPPLKYRIENNLFTTDYVIDNECIKEIFDNQTNSYAYSVGNNEGQADILRSGKLEFESLSLVDVFGVKREILSDQITRDLYLSKSLREASSSKANNIPLAPRFTDPARLKFNWINQNDEIVTQDFGEINHPVIGWVVPNFLDKQLMVYDGDGKEIQILQVTSNVAKTKGVGLQKKNFPGILSTTKVTTNSILQKWLDSITTGLEVQGILTLAEKTQKNNKGVTELQSVSSLLYGEPIALTRCHISFEVLRGANVVDEEDISLLQVPLKIGDYKFQNDGLLGYYELEKDTLNSCVLPANFENAEETKNIKLPSYFKKSVPLYLEPNSLYAKDILMMCHPSAGIHLQTNVLPNKQVVLYKNASQKLVENINNSLMLAPFLSDRIVPGVPIPSIMQTDWKFIHQSGADTWETSQDPQKAKSKQTFAFSKQQIYEGWIRMNHLKKKPNE